MDYREHSTVLNLRQSVSPLPAGTAVTVPVLLITLLFLLLCSGKIHAETAPRNFEPGVVDFNTSTYGAIHMDRDGFIWFGSMGKGPLRYDGYELRGYLNGPAPVPGAMINGIAEDRDGGLWFGTFSEGICRYDKETGAFTRFTHDPEDINSITSNHLPFTPGVITVDREDNVWVGTKNAGVGMYNRKNGKWARFRHDPTDTNSLSHDTVMAVLQDNGDAMWFGTRDGLNRYDPKTGIWKRFRPDPADAGTVASGWIYSLLQDRRGFIWVGTKDGGLSRFDPGTDTFTRFTSNPDDRNSLADNEIWNLMEDREGNIWIGHISGESGGLSVFNRETGTFTRYAHDPGDPGGISTTGVVGMLEEPETGALWLVNNNGLVDRFSGGNARFRNLRHDPDDPRSISSNTVLPMLQDRKGIIWIGTQNGGLNRFDKGKGTFTHYRADEKDPAALPHNYITALHEDVAENLWVGTWGGALSLFNRETGKVERIFRHDPEIPGGITRSRQIKYITGDRDDPEILWIATMEGGLDRFNRKTGIFSHFKNDPENPESLSNDSVVEILDDGRGRLWLTTYGGGLNIMDKRTRRFRHFRHHPDDPAAINADTLYQVHENRKGIFWVTGKGGLSRFDEKTNRFTTFSRASGFPAHIVSNLLEDREGNFWLAVMGAGILKFNPETGSFKHYGPADGLPADMFFWSTRLKDRDGEMHFGGPKGLVSFFPEEIRDNPVVPPVRLTALRQGGRDMALSAAPERVKEIHLDWKSNFFEFQFAALNYTRPEKNLHAYKLEGRDTDWYHTGTKPFGRYTGLSGGTYTLLLKGSNNDGVWNHSGTSLTIHVGSPFWRTRWFYLLLGLGALLCAAAVFHYVVRLNSEIRERRQAVKELNKEKIFTEKSINALVDTFFLFELETGKALRWNRAFSRVSGYSDEEIANMRVPESYYSKADLARAAKTLETVFKTGQDSVELSLLTRSGEKVPTEYTASAIKDGDGTPRYVISVGRDVTERKIAEKALGKLRNHLKNIIDSMPSIIVGVDPDRRVTLWNIKAAKATGIASGEAEGKELAEVLPLMPETNRKILAAVERGKVTHEKKMPLTRGEETRYSDITIFPLMGEGITGAVIRIDDVTDLVRIEAMMVQSEKMLSVGGLAAGMAHEINNPLGGILQNTQVALNRLSSDLPANLRAAEESGISLEGLRKYVEKRGIPRLLDSVRESGEHAAKIVDNMLSFSRKSDSSFIPCDISLVLDRSVELAENDYDLKKKFDFRHIGISREYAEGLPQVPCEETKIRQVFLNILKNAAHAMGDSHGDKDNPPRFILRTANETTHARIEIEDNGPGMEEAVRKRIFEPFFTTKAPGTGTGLGLSISYFIITENHGGTMSVTSVPGKGTKFTVRLPFRESP